MKRRSILLVTAVSAAFSLHTSSFGEDVEYDVCSCKVAQIGARSTLRGGVCQRTEAGNCLMQWGSGSREKVLSGDGVSQEDAAKNAEDIIIHKAKSDFKVEALVSTAGDVSPLQIAIANLSRMPPETYERPGMAESFLLAAGTALVRFNVPLDLLASDLLIKNRHRFVSALRGEDSFSVEPFRVQARVGCLQVDVPADQLHVYIKTPFAKSQSC